MVRTPDGNLRRALRASWALLPGLALLCSGVVHAKAPSASTPDVKRVLVVNSYEQGFVWTDAIVGAIRETLEANATPIELWVEYLDVHRHSDAGHLDRMLELIRNKAIAVPFDVVIATDDAAVGLVAAHAATVFGGRPIVACGINDRTLPTALPEGAVALVENDEPSRLPTVAQQLLPETRRFFVVTDNTRTGASVFGLYQAYAQTRPDLTFVFLDGRVRPLDDILASLRQAGRGDAVLISNFVRDRDHYFPRGRALQQVAAAAGAPVLSPIVSELGQGIMVGLDNRGAVHGAWAGRQALRALQNRSPKAKMELERSGHIVADVQALARWGVDRRRLPAGALLVNEAPSFYRTHKWAVWNAVAFAALQALAILILAANVVRRRRAEQSLRARTEHLEQTLAALEQARVERVELEERMLQGERLEAMGRLAGGIAHDFNNLLTVILSYAEVSATDAPPHSELAGNMEQIRLAGTSAADLTRQILAFSRRQVLSPALIDLNQLVEESSGLIGRLLSENIEISRRLQPGLPLIRIDRTQLQQVLINLAVNARDAMPDGGSLVIETETVDIDAAYVAVHPTMQPGYHVVLSVRDTGTGMPREVLDHIFDPFFTTKPKGHGTGLGLASAYGTVKQSGGWIWAYSKVGEGTTFKIHFPVTPSKADAPQGETANSQTAAWLRAPSPVRADR